MHIFQDLFISLFIRMHFSPNPSKSPQRIFGEKKWFRLLGLRPLHAISQVLPPLENKSETKRSQIFMPVHTFFLYNISLLFARWNVIGSTQHASSPNDAADDAAADVQSADAPAGQGVMCRCECSFFIFSYLSECRRHPNREGILEYVEFSQK